MNENTLNHELKTLYTIIFSKEVIFYISITTFIIIVNMK